MELFLQQLTPELKTLALRGMKVVANAGAFNPADGAARAAIAAQGLSLRVAYVTGDYFRYWCVCPPDKKPAS